jgi:hypothetical protein
LQHAHRRRPLQDELRQAEIQIDAHRAPFVERILTDRYRLKD